MGSGSPSEFSFDAVILFVSDVKINSTFVAPPGDEEAALGNSHPRTASSPKTVDIRAPPAVDGSGPVPSSERAETATEEAPERKEKSVLQAKLTKLAIQIGYAGEFFSFFLIRSSAGNGFSKFSTVFHPNEEYAAPPHSTRRLYTPFLPSISEPVWAILVEKFTRIKFIRNRVFCETNCRRKKLIFRTIFKSRDSN